MDIHFECKVNYNLVALNILKIHLKSGSCLTIDRRQTGWSPITDGKLSMDWQGCYLYAIDDCHIFSDGYNLVGEYVAEEFKELLKGAVYAYFEYDDDISPDTKDYKVEIQSMMVDGEIIYERG